MIEHATLALMVHSALAADCRSCPGGACPCQTRADAFVRASLKSHGMLLGEDRRPVHTVVNVPGRPLRLALSFSVRGNPNGPVDFEQVNHHLLSSIEYYEAREKEVFQDPIAKAWITRITSVFPSLYVEDGLPLDERFGVPFRAELQKLKSRGVFVSVDRICQDKTVFSLVK